MLAPIVLVLALASPTHLAAVDDGDEQYQFIVGLAERGQHKLVVKEANTFLDEHEGHAKAPLARYRLAAALFDLERFDDARGHLERLSKRRGFEFAAEVGFRLGQCELEREEFAAAALAFEAVAQGSADYLRVPATFLLGEAWFRGSDFAKAEEAYARVGKLKEPGDYAADAAHGLAWCAYRLGNYDKAVSRIGRFLSKFNEDPRAGELQFLLGESHLDAQRAEPALAAYEKVPDGPFHDAALRGAGFAAGTLGRHEVAAEWFKRVLEEHPESRFAEEAGLHRGIHLLKAGHAAQAAKALERSGGDGAEALYWRGRARAKAGQADEALRDFDRALGKEPEDELERRIQVARGDALTDLGRTDEAARAYEGSGSDYALHAAAITKLNDGDAEEAARLARQLVDPERGSEYRVDAQLTLGEALFTLGDYRAAVRAFGVVTADHPDEALRARALARTGWCYYLADDGAAAASSFGDVVKRFPESSEAEEALFMRGRASENAGDASTAKKAYERYAERYGSGEKRAEALLRLARLEGEGSTARFEQVVKEAGDTEFAAQAHYELGEHYSAQKELERARGHYAAVAQRFPDHALAAAATYGLGWCHYYEGNAGEAGRLLDALARSGKADPELYLATLELCVWSHKKNGDSSAAQAAYKSFASACKDEPRRFRAAKAAAAALKEGDAIGGADRLYAGLLKETSDRAVAVSICIERAYLALDASDLDGAEAQVRAAYKYAPQDPGLGEAFFFVGEARFAKGEDDKAGELYEIAATAAAPEVAQRALYKGGFALLRKGDHDGATRCFTQLVTEHKGSELFGEGLFLLGECHYRAERYGQAVQWLERVRKEAPKHEVLPKALFRLGLALGKREAWRQSAEVLGELLRKHEGFANATEATLWRGRALAKSDQLRGARQAFQAVVSEDRGVLAAQARIELGRLALSEGDPDAALSEFLRVAVLYAHEEEVAEALFMAGQVLESQKEKDSAVAQYREATTKYPDAKFARNAAERLRALGSE